MKIRMRILFLLTLGILSLMDCVAQKEISEKKLIEDFDYALQELRSQHQGFYNYGEKETTDAAIEALRSELDAPMTKLEFYQIIRSLIGVMNEGHGGVDLPKWTMLKTGMSKSFLPVGVKILDKELAIIQNFGEDTEGLTKGTKLIAINGEPIPKILDKLLPLIATDGFNETSKYEWIGGMNLSLLYRLVYGKRETFQLEIIEPNEVKSQIVIIPAVRYTAFKSKNAKLKPKKLNYYRFGFEQINDSIGYLCIPSFGNDDVDYDNFYKTQFRAIDSLGIKHLILDIQRNGGGEEGNENLLFSYLMEERIQKYRKVTMLPEPYEINKNDRSYKLDKWELKEEVAERGAFTCYSDYFSELGYAQPDKASIYRNKLYVLISGYTFSGGAEFASMIKMTNRGIFIGEETGGAYEGNVSGYSETAKLPNTKIRIDIPTVHFQINVSPKVRGRGVMPDYQVPQTLEDYMGERNTKLEFAKQWIMN